jgi:cell shape-determining protein MreC
MKPYYGLRLIRTFFLSLAIIICIVALASLGTLFAIALFSGNNFDLLRAFFILVTSGFIALLCSAFAQMIDLQLENYSATQALEAQMKELKQQNLEVINLLNKQLQTLRVQANLPQQADLDVIQQQLEERRKKLT